MSGNAGIRGYLLQTIVCLLDALHADNAWQAVALEPRMASDKVDVLWLYPDKLKVVQVKSSQNSIRRSDVQRWAQQLESSMSADEYELLLIGPCGSSVANSAPIGQVVILPPKNLNIDDLLRVAAFELELYLESLNIINIPARIRELIVRALVTKLEVYSTHGSFISRNELNRLLISWLSDLEPQSNDLTEREIEEIRVFKKLFGFEAKREVRAAVLKLYYTSKKIGRRAFKNASEYLSEEGGWPKVIISKPRHILNVCAICISFLFFLIAIGLHPVWWGNLANIRMLLFLFLCSMISLGMYLLTFLIVVNPYIQALRIRNEVSKLQRECIA